MILTNERWQELVKVQMDVNCDVKYTTDMERYPVNKVFLEFVVDDGCLVECGV